MKAILPLAFLAIFAGCSSIRTSMWTRAEDDNLHPDICSNLKGIPVMLRVPSHLEVTITETVYAQYNVNAGNDTAQLDVIKLDRPDLDVAANLKYTEKMFLVDPVRVGAGSGNYGFGFGPGDKGVGINGDDGTPAGHGYIHSANYKANDQTIIHSANLLSTVLSFRPNASSKTGLLDPATLEKSTTPIVKINRTVAYKRFDLGSPTVDEEVYGFMEQHLNGCHSCDMDFNTKCPPSGGYRTSAQGQYSPIGGAASQGDAIAVDIQTPIVSGTGVPQPFVDESDFGTPIPYTSSPSSPINPPIQ